MPTVHGILETALHVKNLPVTVAFYRRLFGFAALLESKRLVALNVGGRNVLLIFQREVTKDPVATPGGTIPGHVGNGPTHFAFAMAREDVAAWKAKLAAEKVALESVVTWPGDSTSLYFRDPENNLVELMSPGFWQLDG